MTIYISELESIVLTTHADDILLLEFDLEGDMGLNPKARQNDVVVQEMPDELLVYDLNTNKAHCLNSSAALVWKSCDGTRNVTDIVREFERSGAGIVSEDFIWLAIEQLQEKNLMANEVEPRFNGRSRRQVLKTIGLASMVAVPVIASLVAPPSVLAGTSCSGCTAFGTNNVFYCTTTINNRCGSNCDSTGSCTSTTQVP